RWREDSSTLRRRARRSLQTGCRITSREPRSTGWGASPRSSARLNSSKRTSSSTAKSSGSTVEFIFEGPGSVRERAMNLWNAFVAISDANPDAPALLLGESTISYGELRGLAERCSAALFHSGIGRGDVVAFQLPKRRETYALLIAALRLGAPYVFIDPKSPAERNQRVIEQVRPAILFAPGELENADRKVIRLPTAADGARWLDGLERGGAPSAASAVTGADPAYIMFTSGSTGEPKGAVIPHQGVLTLMAWGRSLFDSAEGQRFTPLNALHLRKSGVRLYFRL